MHTEYILVLRTVGRTPLALGIDFVGLAGAAISRGQSHPERSPSGSACAPFLGQKFCFNQYFIIVVADLSIKKAEEAGQYERVYHSTCWLLVGVSVM
jgi:hypothetical protein